jgi:hypothetical protein
VTSQIGTVRLQAAVAIRRGGPFQHAWHAPKLFPLLVLRPEWLANGIYAILYTEGWLNDRLNEYLNPRKQAYAISHVFIQTCTLKLTTPKIYTLYE